MPQFVTLVHTSCFIRSGLSCKIALPKAVSPQKIKWEAVLRIAMKAVIIAAIKAVVETAMRAAVRTAMEANMCKGKGYRTFFDLEQPPLIGVSGGKLVIFSQNLEKS